MHILSARVELTWSIIGVWRLKPSQPASDALKLMESLIFYSAEFPKTWIWLINAAVVFSRSNLNNQRKNNLPDILDPESVETTEKKELVLLGGLDQRDRTGFGMLSHCLMVDVNIGWFWYCDASPHPWEGRLISISGNIGWKGGTSHLFGSAIGQTKHHIVSADVLVLPCSYCWFLKPRNLAAWKHALIFIQQLKLMSRVSDVKLETIHCEAHLNFSWCIWTTTELISHQCLFISYPTPLLFRSRFFLAPKK